MFSTRHETRQRGLHTLAAAAAWACMQLAGAGTDADRLTVFAPDEGAAAADFVRVLRETRGDGERIELVRIDPGPAPAGAAPARSERGGAAAPGPDSDDVRAGVRTRGLRKAPADDGWVVAVGPAAARAAIGRSGDAPLVLALLSRLEFERLKDNPALQRAERPVGVLLREVPMREQLALVAAALPGKRRLGVVSTPAGDAVLDELREAAHRAGGWDLQVEIAPDANSIGQSLRALLPHCDALMVLPDLIGDDPAATQALLRSAAGAGVPVFGSSETLVRSGGLAAVVATPEQLARQARALGRKLAGARPGLQVETPSPVTVRVNPTVAQGLGLRLPSQAELDQRVGGIR